MSERAGSDTPVAVLSGRKLTTNPLYAQTIDKVFSAISTGGYTLLWKARHNDGSRLTRSQSSYINLESDKFQFEVTVNAAETEWDWIEFGVEFHAVDKKRGAFKKYHIAGEFYTFGIEKIKWLKGPNLRGDGTWEDERLVFRLDKYVPARLGMGDMLPVEGQEHQDLFNHLINSKINNRSTRSSFYDWGSWTPHKQFWMNGQPLRFFEEKFEDSSSPQVSHRHRLIHAIRNILPLGQST